MDVNLTKVMTRFLSQFDLENGLVILILFLPMAYLFCYIATQLTHRLGI